MDAQTNKGSAVKMTPEQQGIFHDLIRQQTPQWLLNAAPSVRTALYTSLIASFKSRSDALVALQSLKTPDAFCTPLLARALFDKLGTPIDVPSVIFQHVRSTQSLLGLRKKLILPINRDLLTAACENFDQSEELASDYHDSSLFYVPERISGRGNELLALQPNEFATLCRSLDLGNRYQSHIEAVFPAASVASNARDRWIAYAKDNFEVDTHIACLQGHLSTAVYKMLLALPANQQTIQLGENTLGLQIVKMNDVLLHGVMFIGPTREHANDDYRCVMYVPGDPLHPLKEYPNFNHFQSELSRRLRNTAFKTFFLRFVALQDRADFASHLDVLDRRPIPVVVPLDGDDFEGDLFIELYRQRRAQLVSDARILVVPTADRDEAARVATLERYKTIGLNVMVLLLSFVPLLREVMLSVSASQLLTQVFEGIDAWSRGEQEEATDCFFDTLENLMLSATLAAGGAAAGKVFKAVRGGTFLQQLRKVQLPSKAVRLWKPDLSVYRQPRRLASAVVPDERGLVLQDEKQYLPIGNDVYAVEHLPFDQWQLQHPTAPERYQPPLATNDAGAWRHASELPAEWDVLTLMRRFGISAADIPDEHIDRVLAVSGVSEATLRRMYIEDKRPPALLMDVVQRFKVDKAITDFIQQMKDQSATKWADADLQLHLLTSLSNWPKSHAISITNIVGREVDRYGPAKASKNIAINQAALRKGELYATVLGSLSKQQRGALLGTDSREPTRQAQALAERIGKLAEEWQQKLFARVYRRVSTSQDLLSAPLLKAFPSLPGLIAQEMTRAANAHEQRELEHFRVPLRLAEQARGYLRIVRVNRAYEGLYLDRVSGGDTNRLVLDTLAHLPDWPAQQFVQIMDWIGDGYQTFNIGPAQASEKTLMDVFSNHLQARDAQDKILADHPQHTRALYFQTLWEGLPSACRVALGVATRDDGAALREKIVDGALKRRHVFARLLEPAEDIASPQLDEPLLSTTVPPVDTPDAKAEPGLVHRAKELYPLHTRSQIERFLLMLGNNDVLRTRTLEAMRLEYEKLRDGLLGWVNRDTRYQTAEGKRIPVPRRSKLHAAREIARAWRKETPTRLTDLGLTYTLSLAAEPIGDMPVIIADFSHVSILEMNKVGASAGLTTFLQNFKNLRSLGLSGNELTRLPTALEAMTRLEQLDLSENRIRLTADSVSRLADMTALRTLNLSFNPQLTRAPDVSKMAHLQDLGLRGTGVSEWPVGAWTLEKLATLDIRDNAIQQIPNALFTSPLALRHGINIYGNPLSATTLQNVAQFQLSRNVSFGLLDFNRNPLVAAVLPPAAQRSIWLLNMPLVEATLKQSVWDSLAADPNSSDFFRVLTQMRVSADYSAAYSNLSARVWDVVEAAAQSESLRRSMFSLARMGRVTGRDYLLLFSALEVRTLYFRATVAARIGIRTLEAELVRLLRGLFRLQEVERQVQVDIGTRSRTTPLSRQEAQELSLAYRVGLAERLNLPAQPTRLSGQLSIEVTAAQLDHAYEQVVRAEHSEALTGYIRGQELWNEYLYSTFQARYNEIDQRFAVAMGLLEVETDLPRALFSLRMNTLFENFRNERRALFNELTRDALARNPGLPLPAAESAAVSENIPG